MITQNNLYYYLIGFNLFFVTLYYKLKLKSLLLRIKYFLDNRIDSIINNKESISTTQLIKEINYLRYQYELKGINEDWLMQCLKKGNDLIRSVYGVQPHKNQLQTALALFKEYNVELPTGEGKTISLLLASFLSYMSHRKVFILTVNDYLVNRETKWAQKFWDKLNVKVIGLVSDNTEHSFNQTLKAYSNEDSIIIYINNQKIIFDFLEGLSNHGWIHKNIFNSQIYCDEIDLILIDNVSSPFVLSSQPQDTEYQMIRNVNNIFQSMKQNQHFIIESKNIHLTEEGYQFIEDFLRMESIITTNTDLYTDLKGRYLIFIRDCILAHYRMKNNIDYVIKDNRIFVLNELTGRVELGKNFNYPMNLFLELKEGLPFNINQVITTSVFYQSFFNKFRWRSGTTGTLMEAWKEFDRMYQIPCLSVKPHRKSQMRIKNLVSAFNYTDAAKLAFKEIREYHPKGIPILVIASDMYYLNKLEELLRIQGWKYKRLDAHNIEEEDSIINQAGLKDNITLSSNVTGRGVDIILGGTIKTHNRANNKISYQLISERIAQERNWINFKGGLYIIALGLNLSNRIDRQIYGRCARQNYKGTVQPIINFKDQTVLDKITFPISSLNYLKRFMNGRLLKRIIQKVTTKMNESNRLQQYRDHLVAFQHYHSLRDCKHILLLTHSLLTLNNHMVKNRNIVHFNLISSIKHIAKSINIELDLYILHSLSMPGTDSMMDIKASLIIELNNNISKWSAVYQAQLQYLFNYSWLRSTYKDPLNLILINSENIKHQIINEFYNRYRQILIGLYCTIPSKTLDIVR